MRAELLRVIREFNQGTRAIDQLQDDLYRMIMTGSTECLTGRELKRFDDLFSGWVYMYNRDLQPRRGVFGWFLDHLDAIFLGNYRITVEQVREQTRKFEKFLLKEG